LQVVTCQHLLILLIVFSQSCKNAYRTASEHFQPYSNPHWNIPVNIPKWSVEWSQNTQYIRRKPCIFPCSWQCVLMSTLKTHAQNLQNIARIGFVDVCCIPFLLSQLGKWCRSWAQIEFSPSVLTVTVTYRNLKKYVWHDMVKSHTSVD
jgi:hypothetical protein